MAGTDHDEAAPSTEPFRLALEAAPTSMILVDRDGAIVLVNTQTEKMFGYTRAELEGKPIELLVPERLRPAHQQERSTFMTERRARPIGGGRELLGLRKDGSEVPVEIGLYPLTAAEGDFVLSSVVDLSERKRAEREHQEILLQLRDLKAGLNQHVSARTSELLASLKEREALLDAVQGRMKDNLQLICSLISLQIRAQGPGVGRDSLTSCLTRVQAIALVHDKLYQSPDYARIPFAEYADRLVRGVFEARGAPAGRLLAELSVENLALAMDQAIPCGLVLNELLTNAITHAFPDGRQGTIRIALAQLSNGNIELSVADDGVGLPEPFDIQAAQTLGMQLLGTLARELEAELRITGKPGATFRLTFSPH